jgi:hypothetical protein
MQPPLTTAAFTAGERDTGACTHWVCPKFTARGVTIPATPKYL